MPVGAQLPGAAWCPSPQEFGECPGQHSMLGDATFAKNALYKVRHVPRAPARGFAARLVSCRMVQDGSQRTQHLDLAEAAMLARFQYSLSLCRHARVQLRVPERSASLLCGVGSRASKPAPFPAETSARQG